ncbi:hypothetical protein J3459_017448, partial [Metarhizium acridum]
PEEWTVTDPPQTHDSEEDLDPSLRMFTLGVQACIERKIRLSLRSSHSLSSSSGTSVSSFNMDSYLEVLRTVRNGRPPGSQNQWTGTNIVDLPVSRGADINAITDTGDMPLHLAC